MYYYQENNIEEIKPINGSKNYFVGKTGNIYRLYENKGYRLIKSRINKSNGYVYCNVYYEDGIKPVNRVHRIVALAWIENKNPEVNTIVGHLDNNKTNNSIENLYWTTIKENTQKAVDDGLMINDIGIKDSQSMPIACYNNEHELIGVYGSISEAERRIKNFSKSSIHKVLDKTKKGRKGYYFTTINKEFYFENSEKQNFEFEVKYIPKIKTKIKAIFNNEIKIFNSQKEAGLFFGIQQGNVSYSIRSKKPVNNVLFERIEE